MIEICNSLEEVLQREIFWIAKLKSTIDESGYNMTRGGEGNLMTEKSKVIHRIATSKGTLKARQRKEVRDNHKTAMKKVASNPDTLKKRSESMKKVWANKSYKKRLSIISKESWANDDLRAKRSKPIQKLDVITKEVIATFPSARDAARQLGLSQGAISNAARGNTKTSGGFAWKYINVDA